MTRSDRRRPERPPGPLHRWLLPSVAIVALAVASFVATVLLRSQQPGQQVSWARFGTQDVHSLAFLDGDPQQILFGHHGGLQRSSDGGRTWAPLAVQQDAMSTSAATDGSIVIAGHNVFSASRDGGATWQPIDNDLQSLDIHGFTRDLGDPKRMWAYLAIGGLWESDDFGSHWTRVWEENVINPLAVRDGSTTRLLGVGASGLIASDDGGRSWTNLATPATYPMTSFTGTPDGRVLLAGSLDALFRSDDGGRTWTKTAYTGSVFAVATASQGMTIAVVSQETDFYRSDDGGRTWPGP